MGRLIIQGRLNSLLMCHSSSAVAATTTTAAIVHPTSASSSSTIAPHSRTGPNLRAKPFVPSRSGAASSAYRGAWADQYACLRLAQHVYCFATNCTYAYFIPWRRALFVLQASHLKETATAAGYAWTRWSLPSVRAFLVLPFAAAPGCTSSFPLRLVLAPSRSRRIASVHHHRCTYACPTSLLFHALQAITSPRTTRLTRTI